ncbi:3-phosphoglycerate dehydrogenase [Phragmitibacter flavus]|uniref:3-phosphoglycerate dehydrogenase n=1 Tax=Phragmitibacter flavus TaxID=2576071 RepID=A0A5R8KCJ3_9BACT|nr:phosphoglycerate dehydrogenase [Phragmitibacter flavus]TLD70030.1 3-phosphoglycerate dehydrogenase [Phragmitibacter flavus]
MTRVLLTTTSYQDTPGAHHELLASQNFEIHRERGPLPESRMLELAGDFDAFLCGDDEITQAVLDKSLPRLKVISKYGIGLDKIDVSACSAQKLPVLFTPGVNHTTVAEHTFCLLLALVRNLVDSANAVRAGEWKRVTGHEIWNKSIGIVGLGRIGQEVAKRALAFGMKVHGLDPYWPEAFATEHGVTRHEKIETMLPEIDVLSLHANLSESTRHLINAERIAISKPELLVINTSRAELVNMPDMIAALDAGKLGGYGTDVLDEEPPPADHALLRHPKALITPHIGSRTYESVPRQAMRATLNLVNYLNGEKDFIQANKW